jgi:glucose 1-dehydrogenase/3-oxoacyl-[acyl-carrier protein] reductase
MRLEGKVALITGSAHGIGRGIAIAYAREGAKIVVCDLATDESTKHAEDVLKLISEAGGEVELFQGDASAPADMEKVVASTVKRFGKIDVLVNNANPGQRDRNAPRGFLDQTEETIYQGWLLPFKAAYINTQLAAREMIKQGEGGQIITITSVHQERAWGWDSIYGPMKAGLRRLVMSQARELAPYKIRVNCIAPGFIDNRLYEGERGDRYDEYNIRAETEILLGPGKPSDIAGAAVYLASEDARYVTGTCILVDGGMLLPPITEI